MNGKHNVRAANWSRRRFLRGFGGAIVSLPFLETFAPRSAAAQEAAIKRFGVFFCCNGVNLERWFPKGSYGALSESSLVGTANEALAPFRQKLLFPRGLHMSPRGYGQDSQSGAGGDDHGKGMAHKLTAQFADSQNWLAKGPSIDHVIAAQINPGSGGSRRPPLNLMVGNPAGYKGLDFISYSESGRAVAAINNPWNAYAEFMNLSSGTPDANAASDRVTRRRESVLDLVRDQFDALKRGPLSAADREKLDAHFTAIRTIEGRITDGLVSCGDAGIGDRARAYQDAGDRVEQQSEYATIADLQLDIMALALACDFTRVATMHFDRGSGGPTFKWDGMQHEYTHHALSHGKVSGNCFGGDNDTSNGCDNVAGYKDMLFEIDRWHAGKLARLLSKLDSYVEANGKTVLDNSVILYTNELSDGRAHSFMDLPYLLVGSADGYLKQGQYVLLGQEGNDNSRAPHNKLLNTIVNSMGIASDWFGAPEGSGGETMQGGVYEALLV